VRSDVYRIPMLIGENESLYHCKMHDLSSFKPMILLFKQALSAKPAKPEPMGRADFYAELAALKDHIHAGHLAILEKLDTNHRELLAALERQASRINTLESGLARVDERTKV